MSVVQYIDMLADEMPAPAAPLSEIYFGHDKVYMVPFFKNVPVVSVHPYFHDEQRGYIDCVGEAQCLLCRGGFKPSSRVLLPVYSPEHERVMVANLPDSRAPKAVFPQILRLWKAAEKAGKTVILSVSKIDNSTYTVTGNPIPEGGDDGKEAIAQFMADVESGSVDLTSIIKHYSADELMELPTLKKRLVIEGVK